MVMKAMTRPAIQPIAAASVQRPKCLRLLMRPDSLVAASPCSHQALRRRTLFIMAAAEPVSMAWCGVVRTAFACTDAAKPAEARRRDEGSAKAGEPPRNRTENRQIKSLLLCQLS